MKKIFFFHLMFKLNSYFFIYFAILTFYNRILTNYRLINIKLMHVIKDTLEK